MKEKILEILKEETKGAKYIIKSIKDFWELWKTYVLFKV